MVFFTFTLKVLFCGSYVDLLVVSLVLNFKFQLKIKMQAKALKFLKELKQKQIEHKTETNQSEF